MSRAGIVLALAFLICISASQSFAVSVAEQAVTVDINEDGTSNWEVILRYDNATDNSDFFVMAYIKNVEVYSGERRLACIVEQKDLGNLITCSKANASEIIYRFTAYNLVRNIGGSRMFSYGFPITGIIDEFTLTVNLPLGAGIVEADRINLPGLSPFSPDNGAEGSDGRKIFVKWFFTKPMLGETINVSVLFEQIFGPTEMVVAFAIALIGIPALIMFVFFMRRKGKIDQVLPILNENERAVMKVILESHGDVDQRKIIKECDMSKSKVSRILKDLEERGLIHVIKRGRSNKVKLVYDRRKIEHKPEKKDNPEPAKKEPEKKYYQEQQAAPKSEITDAGDAAKDETNEGFDEEFDEYSGSDEIK